jgi:hypothetical protein
LAVERRQRAYVDVGPVDAEAKTAIAGILAGTNAMFRYRALTKSGPADWSQPTALLVK